MRPTQRLTHLAPRLMVLACVPCLASCSLLFGVDEYQSSRCNRPDEGAYRYIEAGNGVAVLDVTEMSASGVGGAGGGAMAGGTGGGSETVFHEDQPLDMEIAATVTHRSECDWDLTVHRNDNQTETTTYRGVENGNSLVELSSTQQSTWSFIGTTTTMTTTTCQIGDIFRPNMVADDSWVQRCTGDTDAQDEPLDSNIRVTYQGREDVALPGGRNVATHRFRRVTLYSRALVGEKTDLMWFDVDTGLQVKIQRTISLKGEVDVYDVHFNESSEITLAE